MKFRTHWFPEGYGKFAAARLAELRADLSGAFRRNAYLNVFWENDEATLRQALASSGMTLDQLRENMRREITFSQVGTGTCSR